MQGMGWTKVISKCSGFRWDVFPFGGRNRSSVSSIVTSFYVSEFPEFFNAKRLFELFGCSRNVVEVAISPRRNIYGKRFTFARFSEVEDGRLLAIRLDNILIEGKKLHVNLPRFSRVQGVASGRIGSSTSKGFGGRIKLVTGVSTCNVVSGDNRGLSCSYAEAVGFKGQVSGAKKEELAMLNFNSNKALKSRFEKAYVGRVCIPGSSYNIQNYLEMEGVYSIKVTPLRGNSCLLEEMEEGFIGDLIKEGESWWKSWFSVIEKWEAGMMDGRKDAWFRIYGIPIHVWSPDFFVSLGELWGRFLCIDGNTSKGEAFDVARILVNIPLSLSITDCVLVCIDGVIFNLCIREDAQSLYRHVDSNQKVLSSEGDTSDSDYERLMLESDSGCSGDPVGLEDREVHNPDGIDQKAEAFSDKHGMRHSGVIPEVGTRCNFVGPSGVDPEGNCKLFKCFDSRSESDVMRAEVEIIRKVPVESEAGAVNLLASRSRIDTMFKRQSDLERGNEVALSGNCVQACSDDSSESVECLKPVNLSRLSPVASKACLHCNSVKGIWKDGRSGLGPDGSNPSFRPTTSYTSGVPSKAGSVKDGGSDVNTSKSNKLLLHSGHSLDSEEATKRCPNSDSDSVSFPTGGHSKAGSVKDKGADVNVFKSSKSILHSGSSLGPEGGFVNFPNSDSGSACVGTVLLNCNVVCDSYPKQCVDIPDGDRVGGKNYKSYFEQ